MRGFKDTALGAVGILAGVTLEAADAFGPLKAVLGAISAIYRNYEVRLRDLLGSFSDKHICRKRLPSGRRSKTSYHA